MTVQKQRQTVQQTTLRSARPLSIHPKIISLQPCAVVSPLHAAISCHCCDVYQCNTASGNSIKPSNTIKTALQSSKHQDCKITTRCISAQQNISGAKHQCSTSNTKGEGCSAAKHQHSRVDMKGEGCIAANHQHNSCDAREQDGRGSTAGKQHHS